MTTGAALVLGLGVGFGAGIVLGSPLTAPLGIWLMERSIAKPSKPADYRRWPQ